jgi:predicted transposase YdaD
VRKRKNKQKVEHWLWCLRASKNENIEREKFVFVFSFSSLKENDQINEIRKQKRQNGGRYQILPDKIQNKGKNNWEKNRQDRLKKTR